MIRKKATAIVLLLISMATLCGSGFSRSEPKLTVDDESKVSAYTESDSAAVSIADGIITYQIPKAWTTVENDEALQVDAGRGHAYFLNALKEKKEAEYFAVFYFSNEKYLKNDSDAKETRGIERAVITNICPEEKLGAMTIAHYRFPTASSVLKGQTLDYYVGNYDTHRVEFVMTPVQGGLCVMVYAYNEDYSAVEEIRSVIKSLQVKN